MKIIAVTSCPMGMAHTYMASAALKRSAKKKGYEIKVETQGSMGIRDKISKEEIQNADILILATDVATLEPERFKDSLTYKTTTSKIIRNADSIVDEAINLVENK
jgi:fructose-specific phosphotransferase system IIB component